MDLHALDYDQHGHPNWFATNCLALSEPALGSVGFSAQDFVSD